jgi:hypothetical protein
MNLVSLSNPANCRPQNQSSLSLVISSCGLIVDQLNMQRDLEKTLIIDLRMHIQEKKVQTKYPKF